MRKRSGITGSTLVTIVMGIVVGTAITVQEIRSRELAEHPETAANMLSTPREFASRVDPQAFIPGFNPDEDVHLVLQVLAEAEVEAEAEAQAPRTPALIAKTPKVSKPTPTPKVVAEAPKSSASAPVPVSERSDPRLSLRDLEDLKQRLMAYADVSTETAEHTVSGGPDIRPAASLEMRTVATFLVMKPSGPRVLVCVRDRFGTQVYDLELSGDMATRLSQNVPSVDNKPALLLLQRFLSP
ncbi:MAG: hypothetical protein HRF45_05460 [Fimbriimonadia bacterium]|jgi:hypothetical protein